MQVDLLGIKTKCVNGRMQVTLVFNNKDDKKYSVTYSESRFLVAMGLVGGVSRERRPEGLAILNILPGTGKQSRLYLLRFPDGTIGKLSQSVANQMASLLAKGSQRPAQLREALEARREFTLRNIFLDA